MQEDKNDGYGTLEWIFSQSEEGLFLAVAGEPKQKEVMAYFADRRAGIYDCKEHSGTYMFRDLKEWGDSLQEMETLLVFNFQYAMQHDEDYKRLNFSRDMLAGMRKNLFFFTTAWGDDSLASKACDFYSFLKMRILLERQGKADRCSFDGRGKRQEYPGGNNSGLCGAVCGFGIADRRTKACTGKDRVLD